MKVVQLDSVVSTLLVGFSCLMFSHPAGTLVSIQGLALVVDGSNGMLEGSIVLQKTLRPFAPMPVPQVVPGRLLFRLPPSRNR